MERNKKCNIIDNESANMASSHGVIQGYNGIAAVDDKHQLIVWAEAFGDFHESGHFPKILNGIEENCRKSGVDKKILTKVKITADSGFHNTMNMQLVCEKNIDAYIPDNRFRQRGDNQIYPYTGQFDLLVQETDMNFEG